MDHSPLTALSPLDGRYAPRMAALRPLLSEFGLMHRRVQVEVEWFIALSDAGLFEFEPLSESGRGMLRSLVLRFSEADAQAIKDIEKTTNHDVKAVEYWLKSRFEGQAELQAAAEFVHFACTSEDINNTSHALMLQAAREQVLLPALDAVAERLHALATTLAGVPMLSRTHGQNASPTTVGKEVANVAARLATARARIAAVPLGGYVKFFGDQNAASVPDHAGAAVATLPLGEMARPNHLEFVDNARGQVTYMSLARVDDGGPNGAASSRLAIIDRSVPLAQQKVVGLVYTGGREAHGLWTNPANNLLYVAHEQDELPGTPNAGQTVCSAFDVSTPLQPKLITQIALGSLKLPSGELRNKKSINLVYVRVGAKGQTA